jgi:hypothetical protein
LLSISPACGRFIFAFGSVFEQSHVPDLEAYGRKLIDISERAVGAVKASVLTTAPCGLGYRTVQVARASKAADARHINQQVSIMANLETM